MSWNRKNRVKHYDKREHYLILQMIEAQRNLVKADTTGQFVPTVMQRNFLRDMDTLEAKARAEWAR